VTDRLRDLSEQGLWQVVEFADYTADLPLWEELAEAAGGAVLDLGCGVGRVARHLAAVGFDVLGVDSDPGLVADFGGQPEAGSGSGGEARAEVADASRLAELSRAGGDWATRRFELILAPQQFVQLFDPPSRQGVLESVRALLAPGGTAAFAICEELPEESIHFPGVMPDARESEGWYYSSMPVAIEPSEGWITSSRRRDIVGPDGQVDRDLDDVRIYRLGRSRLERELRDRGLEPFRTVGIPQTERHMGSTAVIARSGYFDPRA
jgi:SAM-dependent methyltransferase